MSPNLLMGKQRPREVKPLAQGDATDECRRSHGHSGPLATSLRSEPLLFTSSEPRPTLLQVPRSGGEKGKDLGKRLGGQPTALSARATVCSTPTR